MNDKFPLMDYRIWEINWLNEFWNHQIAQNKIFLEVENIGCEFVYTELCERHSGKILLRPDENELYRYGGQNTIIVDRLISEAPKGSPYPYNTPLEKIVVDLFANRNLKSMVHTGEYATALLDIMGNTGLDETEVHLIQCERSGMTKYSLLHEKEKVEYGNEMAKKAALMEKYSIAQNLLNMGLDIVDIMETIGLTETEILSLKEEQIV